MLLSERDGVTYCYMVTLSHTHLLLNLSSDSSNFHTELGNDGDMFSSARHAALRTLPAARRRLATTAGAAGSSATEGEVYSVIDSIAGFNAASSLSSPPSAARHPASTQPAVINIPPAEDPLLHYLTSCLQSYGHRQKAARITARTLLHIHTLTRAPPLPILRKAIENIAPAVRCISNKHAGKTVVYPIALSEKQRTRIAIEWILKACDSRAGKDVEERLAKELVAIVEAMGKPGVRLDEVSAAYKKKEEVHKYAMMNRGNALRSA